MVVFKALYQAVANILKRVLRLITEKLSKAFNARGAFELLATVVLVTVAAPVAAAIATTPFIRIPETDWGKMLLAPVVFGAAYLMMGACMELAILLTFVGVKASDDEFISRTKRRVALIEAREVQNEYTAQDRCRTPECHGSVPSASTHEVVEEADEAGAVIVPHPVPGTDAKNTEL